MFEHLLVPLDGSKLAEVVLPLAARLPDGVTARCSLGRDCSCLGCEIRRTVLR